MTLEAWVRPSAVRHLADVIYKGATTSITSSHFDSTPGDGGFFAGSTTVTFGTLAVNAWTHLAATYDGGDLRLYVNGTQVSSRPGWRRSPLDQPAADRRRRLYGQRFAGLIDEVRVYTAR